MTSSPDPDELTDILIVDDTPENLRLLSIILQEAGYHVRKAISGDRALQVVDIAPPELILLDISMPEMDGYEVCRRLKTNPLTASIPVIFISALNQLSDKVIAFNVGGVDYITKPFQEQEVLARVENHLKLNRMQRQLQTLNQSLEDRVKERTLQLQTANDQLRQLETELRRSLLQKQELVDILEAQNAALKETDQLKEEFLRTISHELRTPLNTVIVFVQLILDGYSSDRTEEIDMLQRVACSAEHLLGLINDILLASEVKAGQPSLELEILDLRACLNAAILLQQPQFAAKSLELRQQTDADPLWVHGDRDKLCQAFRRVLDNASKFTETGYISVKTDRQQDPVTGQNLAIVVIEDTGVGIPPDQQHKLFRPFTMVDGSTTRKQGGAGLGLVITRYFIELMSGKITLDSSGLDQGTTVTITLPLAQAERFIVKQ
jgi:signal transduction histidine kinase